MPVAMARELEYFVRMRQVEQDIRLFPLVLTAGQVQEYRLLRTPIKESERRRSEFEHRYGEGATELDALEAIAPGALARIEEELELANRRRRPANRFGFALQLALLHFPGRPLAE
ncbi:hypothetical protein KSC_069460 [Ktedonobacter sp. SOSP1-52]|nr:hypothetical protein KSC_069460 [Ktedonobacter sp. SOSP1-52]